MQGLTLPSLLATCLCVSVQSSYAVARIDLLVKTKLGLVRGLRSTDGNYSMFMGIPYAVVDGANPFGASSPHPGFDEVFNAFDDSAVCPQVEEFHSTVVGSLDCLTLNIYVPNSATSRYQLPVLVWIHGGDFYFGISGRYLYGPSFLIRHDIVLVTINYRLGPYGFLCLDTAKVPGNQGLKDQYLALKWIKNNIESFGGDSCRITIFGESAGAASVDLHLYYNKENLYSNAILQSGSAISSWAVAESDRTVPLKIADHLGFSTDDVEEALSFLSIVNTNMVIAASSNLDITYSPCVEKIFEGVESFMTEHPLNVEVPRAGTIPILIGQNNDEQITLIQSSPNIDNIIYDKLSQHFNFDEDQMAEMEMFVRRFYIGDEVINDQSIPSLAYFYSDFFFNHPTQRSVVKYLANGASAVYQYMFSYTGKRNYVKQKFNLTKGGAGHGDELGYLFDIAFLTGTPTPEDQVIIDRITTLWTNFAKYGNPTPEISALLPVSWSPATEDTMFYLNIDSVLRVERTPFHDRMAFWDLFYKFNNQLQKGYEHKCQY